MEALNSVGQTYRTFRITQYLPLKELNSTLVELVHEPTGARIMQIVNDDPENLFSLSFQTLPDSSNGVAHILEHIVLCGSKKFPIKDPFFSMTRRSLNTYMNALTGQDFTCYPASSQVEKDFYNLLEVYLDAVFYPHLKKESFLQEGHRLAFTDPEDSASPLVFQGVVYNEMKGAMNSPDSRLLKALGPLLTPDLTYAHNSGGEPKEIPHLTLEELKEFHQTFYHPSRCLFFFYGNLPLKKNLDFLKTHVLKETKKMELMPPLPLQKRFRSPIHAEDFYPISSREHSEKHAMIAISWLTASIAEQTDLLALSLIASILMDTDASFLKKTLIQSGLCTQADASLDLEMSEVPFTIVCKGCKEDAAKAIEALCLKTLREFISQPISKEKIENALHQLEFERIEIGAEGIPFGLTLFFRAALAKQHGISSEHTLLIHSLFEDLRNRLKDTSFLPGLIQKYLLENPHYVVLTMKGSLSLEEEERKEEEKTLHTISSKLTEKEKRSIVEQSRHLKTFQEEQEEMSVDCLPKVSLKDVSKEPKEIPLKKISSSPLPVFWSPCFTNQILYTDLVFDLPHLTLEELPLASLYARLFTEMGVGGRNYEENLAELEAYTGGASAALSLCPNFSDPDSYRPSFTLRMKALKRHTEPLFHLLKDYVKGIDLSDEKRLQEWLLQHATELKNHFNKSALHYAIQQSLSGCSQGAFVYNEWHGLPYFHAVEKWIKDPGLISALQKLQKKLLKGPVELVLGCDEEQLEEIEKAGFYGLPKLIAQTRDSSWHPCSLSYSLPKVSSEAHFIASPVAFTAQGLRVCSYKDPDSALLLIAADLLDNVVLHTEIREKGGAYGSGANYTPLTGNFYFYSYRDPHLLQTLKTFENALERIAEEDFDEEDLEEAKLGVIQGLDTPTPPGQKAIMAYSWQRSGISFEDRQVFRNTILQAKTSEVKAAVKRRLLKKPRTTITFLGQTLFDKEKAGSALDGCPQEDEFFNHSSPSGGTK